MENSDSITTERIQATIRAFLDERLQAKLVKLKEGDDKKRQKLIEYHQPRYWIGDAARRVRQIQQVTHALKFSHPEAKGSSLFSHGNPGAGEALLGSHSLPEPVTDVVGNAAALDVYKFLRLEVGGKTLLQLAQAASPELLTAFSPKQDEAHQWIEAFVTLNQPNGVIATHKLAKQVYWPLDHGGYHLLAPMFPSSLVHAQYRTIREHRFGKAAKAAREARYKGETFESGYHEYPWLAIIKFGGTKPQNISQLNSERHGEAWLLPSLPPVWKSHGLRPPCHVASIFDRWIMGFRSIREPLLALKDFLHKTAYNNVHIRQQRAEMTRHILDEVLQLAASIQRLPAGWSASADCKLERSQQFWLDPSRAIQDDNFAQTRRQTDWQGRVTSAFGRWLNGQLESDRLPMSDTEFGHWKTTLDKEQRLLREELSHD